MEKAKFSFTGKFPLFAVISIFICLPGLIALILLPFGVRLFNFDIDFIGGTTFNYEIGIELTSDDVSAINTLFTETTGLDPSSIQRSSRIGEDVTLQNSVIYIRSLHVDDAKKTAFEEALQDKYSTLDLDNSSARSVGSAVGRDLQRAAILSALIAMAGIMLYIAFRFQFISGISAVISLAHDLLFMLGVYVIFQIPVNMNLIAAILTILGYSINGNIIVFDRIRETMKLVKKVSFADIVNLSTYETLPRTINTTITTVLPILMIIILGVSSVRNFTIPMMAGILCGAYSSIFLSGPLWNILRGSKQS